MVVLGGKSQVEPFPVSTVVRNQDFVEEHRGADWCSPVWILSDHRHPKDVWTLISWNAPFSQNHDEMLEHHSRKSSFESDSFSTCCELSWSCDLFLCSVEVHAVVYEEIWCGCGQEEEGRSKGREAGQPKTADLDHQLDRESSPPSSSVETKTKALTWHDYHVYQMSKPSN